MRFTRVGSGTYTLLEKAAPEDYVTSDKTYELTVSGSRVTMNGKSYSPVTFVNRRAAELNRRDHTAFLVGYAEGTFGPGAQHDPRRGDHHVRPPADRADRGE